MNEAHDVYQTQVVPLVIAWYDHREAHPLKPFRAKDWAKATQAPGMTQALDDWYEADRAHRLIIGNLLADLALEDVTERLKAEHKKAAQEVIDHFERQAAYYSMGYEGTKPPPAEPRISFTPPPAPRLPCDPDNERPYHD